jgi:hypothetical protein
MLPKEAEDIRCGQRTRQAPDFNAVPVKDQQGNTTDAEPL